MKSLVAFLMMSLLSAVASAADEPAAAKVDLDKGKGSYQAVCAACHGETGNGISAIPTQPILARQHPEYLSKQLQDFKSGKRVDPIMKPFADMLSDEDVNNISHWLAKQNAYISGAKDKDLLVDGEKIYRGGINDGRRIPACAACHSPNGAGLPIEFPRVSGQFAEYNVKQLHDFRVNSNRHNDIMHEVTRWMTDAEIKAVSDYISGLH